MKNCCYILLIIILNTATQVSSGERIKQSIDDISIAKNCNQRVVSIAWHTYLPYSYKELTTSRVEGQDITFLSSLLDKMGCQYSFQEMTWARTLSEIEKGNIDISMYAFKTRERESRFLFSTPYRKEAVRIAFLKKNLGRWKIRSLPDIVEHDLIIATDTHVWAGSDFEQFIDERIGHQILHVHGTNRRIRMLLEERVDAIIGDPLTIKVEAEKYKASSLYFIDSFVIYESPVHFILNKSNFSHEFVEELDNLIKENVLEEH